MNRSAACAATLLGLVLSNDPSILGTRLDFQAGVFDPAATAGVALSNGVEVWIL